MRPSLIPLTLALAVACADPEAEPLDERAAPARAALVGVPGGDRAGLAASSAPRPAGSVLPTRDVLVDRHGLDVMAIVDHGGVRALDRPGGAPVANLQMYVPPYYVLAEEAGGYVLGAAPDADQRIGWVAAEDVTLWTTRIGVEPVDRVSLYANDDDLVELLRTGGTEAQPFAVTDRKSTRLNSSH